MEDYVTPQTQVIEVWGDLACYSRPELKVERFSYPCLTPSAARGIFDAIYVKPRSFRWQVHRIELLKAPRYIALRRNEVKDKANVNAVKAWMAGKKEPEPIWADGDKGLLGSDEKGRTQRQTMALQDVHYRLHGEIRPWPGHEQQLSAFEAQFRRRVDTGKCFHQPYFGCREFAAFFSPASDEPTADVDLDIGLMLYDVFDLSQPNDSSTPPAVSLFSARVRQGVLEVPEFSSPEVLKVAELGPGGGP